MTPESIIAAARECIGTRFHHQGRVLGVGMDCAGVLVHILDRHGLPYTDERGYPRYPYHGLMQKILDGQPSLRKIPRRDIATGDVLLMRYRSEPQHVAIYAGRTIIHGSSEHGRCVEHTLDPSARFRVTAAYRIVDER